MFPDMQILAVGGSATQQRESYQGTSNTLHLSNSP
jgi:hypothetical protein